MGKKNVDAPPPPGAMLRARVSRGESPVPMLEREVASNFNSLFSQYGILAPINNAQGGWPDRFIQLSNSRVIAVEIKSIQQLKTGELRLADFRKEQAAWLAKWQRNDGKCFLFIGITDFQDSFTGYGIITLPDWRLWLEMPNTLLGLGDLTFISNEPKVLLGWFRSWADA